MNALHNPTKMWCIVLKDIDTDEVFKWHSPTPLSGHVTWVNDFIKFCKEEVIEFIGHNLIGYDMPNINRLAGVEVMPFEQVTDTLVLSRLFRPVTPFKGTPCIDTRLGGHSLAAWGLRLGDNKIDFHDFDEFTHEMLVYCVQDVNVNHKMYKVLMRESEGFSQQCIDLEHKVALLLHQQVTNGFFLDKALATKLVADTRRHLDEMYLKLQEVFPPKPKFVRNLEMKITKGGTIGKVAKRIFDQYTEDEDKSLIKKEDGTYDLYQNVVFNPNSNPQVAERLLDIGWKPTVFTPKGNVSTKKVVLEEALDELVAIDPKLKHLVAYNQTANRNDKARTWLRLSEEPQWFKEGKSDGRVHGQINPIGAGTHRCSHYSDNMANIASIVTADCPPDDYKDIDFRKLKPFTTFDNDKKFLHFNEKKNEVEYSLTGLEGGFGWESRSCWTVPEGKCLVGADASGIQLRALAHYMNDPAYTKALLEEDIHIVNQKAAGLPTRPIAKTFIYAWLLGGGDWKIGSIKGTPPESEWASLFYFARNRKKWGKDLLTLFQEKTRKDGRKADRKTIATTIQGFQVKEQFLDRTPALKRLKTIECTQSHQARLPSRSRWQEVMDT